MDISFRIVNFKKVPEKAAIDDSWTRKYSIRKENNLSL